MSDLQVENGGVFAAHIFSRIWGFVKGHVVQPVPDDDGPCEFNCRKGQCTLGEWETCEIRLQSLARRSILGEAAKQPAAD